MAHLSSRPTTADRIDEIQEHEHSACLVYPTGAAGVQIACGDASNWTLGAFTEIVPAGVIGAHFDIHWINLEAASEDTTYELVLYAVSEELGRIRFTTINIANATILPSFPFQCVVVDADTQIQAKLMSATGVADTVTISLYYHHY